MRAEKVNRYSTRKLYYIVIIAFLFGDGNSYRKKVDFREKRKDPSEAIIRYNIFKARYAHAVGAKRSRWK